MKNVGLGILIVGVGLAASFGARLSPEMLAAKRVAGKAAVAGAAAKAAKAKYCAARAEAKMIVADGCPDPEADRKAAEVEAAKSDEQKAEEKEAADKAAAEKAAAAKSAPKPERADLIAAGEAKIKAWKASSEALPDAVKAQRDAWIAAEAAAVAPGVDAKLAPTPPPGARVGSWFAQSGLPFLAGLALVIIGAVLARRAVKAEASSDTKKGGGDAVDFGAVLAQLTIDMRALAEGMGEAPGAGQIEEIKARLEALHFEAFDPIVEARVRIQVRFGLANFAELFSPFSSAERRANRAWSALVDHHWPEARDSLRIAASQLEEAKTILDRLLAA